MKTILRFSLLVFLFSNITHASDVCPTEDQWTALKYRAFYSKLFQIATRCHPHRYEGGRRINPTEFGEKIDRASMKITDDCAFRPFHVDQMRIASEFYDRYRPAGANQTDRYSTIGNCQRSTPVRNGNRNTRYNREWETYETEMLNGFSLQISRTQTTPAWPLICQQVMRTIDQILEIESEDDLKEIAIEHPYSNEHDLNICGQNGTINTAAMSADGTTVTSASAPPPPPPPADDRQNPEESGDDTERRDDVSAAAAGQRLQRTDSDAGDSTIVTGSRLITPPTDAVLQQGTGTLVGLPSLRDINSLIRRDCEFGLVPRVSGDSTVCVAPPRDTPVDPGSAIELSPPEDGPED